MAVISGTLNADNKVSASTITVAAENAFRIFTKNVDDCTVKVVVNPGNRGVNFEYVVAPVSGDEELVPFLQAGDVVWVEIDLIGSGENANAVFDFETVTL